jgi:hypothetical protein
MRRLAGGRASQAALGDTVFRSAKRLQWGKLPIRMDEDGLVAIHHQA